MTYLDVTIIVARHFDTTPDDVMYSTTYNKGTYPRAAAMLICHEVLKASTIKLAKWYSKHQHTTPLRAMNTARNLIKTDRDFRAKFKAALYDVQIENLAMLEKKTIKQVYNLNYRVREKGIVVRTRSRTVSCSVEALEELKDSQLQKLLNTHKYVIQLSII